MVGNKKTLSLLFLLLVTSIVATPLLPVEVEAQELDPIDMGITDPTAKVNSTYARGASWSVTCINGAYGQELGLPQWVFNGSLWVPYIFVETPNYFQVQSGLIGARIFKAGYAEFWDPDMTEVRLYEETWEVQYWTGNKWSVCDTYSPEFTVSSDKSTVNITASFITGWPNSGEMVFHVKYIFREGSTLKHEVDFTSYAVEQYEFRVVQKWAGIVAAKVKHDEGEDIVSSAIILNGSQFRFLKEDGSLSIHENQWDIYYGRNETTGEYYVLENENLKPVEIDIHSQGLKADFVFGNWTLTQNEKLKIDPATATLSNPTEDGEITYYPGEEFEDKWEKDGSRLAAAYDRSFTMDEVERFYIEWSIASIPSGSDILDSAFKYHGAFKYSNGDCHIHKMELRPSIQSDLMVVFNDIGDGTYYAGPSGFPVVGELKEVDLGDDADAEIESRLTNGDWFAIGVQLDSETPTKVGEIHAEEYGSANPKPTLYVTYTSNYIPSVTSASIPDRDDSDNINAMRKYYSVIGVVDDLDGATDIDKVYLQIKNGAAVIGEFRATSLTGTPAWDIQTGASIFDLDGGSCTWEENGNEGTATFKIRAEWDIAQYNDLELAVYVEDASAYSSGWTVKQTNYVDIIKRLVTTDFAASDGRMNKGDNVTLSGSVRYATTTSGNTPSSFAPPDNQFTAIHIHDSAHGSKGSDTTIVNGAFSIGPFSIPDAVQSNSYHVYLDLVDDYTDADAPDGDLVSVIGDRWKLLSFWASTESPMTGNTVFLYATAELEYDGHAPEGEDILVIEGEEFTWDWSEERFYTEVNKSTAGSLTYDDLTSIEEYSYNITIGTMNGLSVTVTWYDHEFHFYGLYNENGTFAEAYNVSAHLPSETEIFEVDGYLNKYFVEEPSMFSWPLIGGGNRYIYQFQDNETIYFFTPDATYSIYSFTIRDYTGSVGFADTFLESLRVINGTEHMIERMLIWDTANAVPLTLVQSQIYALQVRFADGSTYRFGYFIPGAAATPTLSIYAVAFTDQAHIVAEHVTVEAMRLNDHIRVNYKDELDDTDSVFVEVCLTNGTQVWNDTGVGDILQFNWYGPNNETDYMVKVAITHGYYGELTYSCWLAGAQADPEDPFDLTLFGDWPIEGAFAVFLIIGTACLFSRASGVIGIGVTVLMAATLTGVGWIDISYSVLAASFTLVVLWGLSGGNK